MGLDVVEVKVSAHRLVPDWVAVPVWVVPNRIVDKESVHVLHHVVVFVNGFVFLVVAVAVDFVMEPL